MFDTINITIVFQFTLPRGEQGTVDTIKTDGKIVSIHAPM